MHSYKEPEVAVKCLDIIKYHIGYVKVWNEAGIEAYRPAPAIPLRLRLRLRLLLCMYVWMYKRKDYGDVKFENYKVT